MTTPIAGQARDQLADRAEQWPVSAHSMLARGQVCTFVNDEVSMPDQPHTFRRQYLTHPGAVGIIALDDHDRVAVVRQYRHPVGMVLVEPPAGLLDVAGEDPLVAAKRELAEEVGLAAGHWQVLVDLVTSPGGSEESARIYLATQLSTAARPAGFELADEEAQMVAGWEPFGAVVDAIFAGRLQSPLLVAGVMALAAARATGRHLRPSDSEWPIRQLHAGQPRDRA